MRVPTVIKEFAYYIITMIGIVVIMLTIIVIKNKVNSNKKDIQSTEEYQNKLKLNWNADCILYKHFDYSTNSPFVDCFSTPEKTYIEEDDFDEHPAGYNIFDIGFPFITVGDFYIVKFEELSRDFFKYRNDTLFSKYIYLDEIKIKVNSDLAKETVYVLVVVKQKTCNTISGFIMDKSLLFEEVLRFSINDILNDSDYIVNKINSISNTNT